MDAVYYLPQLAPVQYILFDQLYISFDITVKATVKFDNNIVSNYHYTATYYLGLNFNTLTIVLV